MSAEATARHRKKLGPEECRRRGRITANKRRAAYPEESKNNRESPRGRWYFFTDKAKRRGLEICFTFEQWCELAIGASCHYCGNFITSNGGSLDRKDSSIGYILDNVVPCCASCNKVKSDVLSYEEMVYLMPLLMVFRLRAR
jgi:hypothetical protein